MEIVLHMSLVHFTLNTITLGMVKSPFFCGRRATLLFSYEILMQQ